MLIKVLQEEKMQDQLATAGIQSSLLSLGS
jgi:hypothetical protein